MASKTAQKGDKDKIGTMTDQMRAFAREYTVDFNGKNAAIRAGYAPKAAHVRASQLLSRDDVADEVRRLMDNHERNTGISAERVLRETWGIATADVNDLVEFRRRCCRHCYGIDYGYQRTIPEISEARRVYNQQRKRAEKLPDFDAEVYEEFDERGGPGYDARKAPNPDCQKCWGDGIGDAFFKPTADLSPAARALYAGVKQTKEGYQMLTIDKLGAMEKLFKHLNLYKAETQEKEKALANALANATVRVVMVPPKQTAEVLTRPLTREDDE